MHSFQISGQSVRGFQMYTGLNICFLYLSRVVANTVLHWYRPIQPHSSVSSQSHRDMYGRRLDPGPNELRRRLIISILTSKRQPAEKQLEICCCLGRNPSPWRDGSCPMTSEDYARRKAIGWPMKSSSLMQVLSLPLLSHSLLLPSLPRAVIELPGFLNSYCRRRLLRHVCHWEWGHLLMDVFYRRPRPSASSVSRASFICQAPISCRPSTQDWMGGSVGWAVIGTLKSSHDRWHALRS